MAIHWGSMKCSCVEGCCWPQMLFHWFCVPVSSHDVKSEMACSVLWFQDANDLCRVAVLESDRHLGGVMWVEFEDSSFVRFPCIKHTTAFPGVEGSASDLDQLVPPS